MRVKIAVFGLLALGLGLPLPTNAPAAAQNPPSPNAQPTITSPSAPAPTAPQPMANQVAAPAPSAPAPTAPQPVVAEPMAAKVADPVPAAPAPTAPTPAAPTVPASYESTSANSATPPAAAAASAAAASRPEGPLDAARPRLSNARNRIDAVRMIVDDKLRVKAITSERAEKVRALLARQEKAAAAKAGTHDLTPSAARALNRNLDRLVLSLTPPKTAP